MNKNKTVPLTGVRSGKVIVIRENVCRNDKGRLMCDCQCDCGKRFLAPRYRFLTGGNKIYSCGCTDRRKTLQGRYKHRLRKIYLCMLKRCYYKKDISYCYYGAKGVGVCDEWYNDFFSFYNWAINNGYKNNLTLDRINVDKGYSPDNCRWVDIITQNNNKSNTHYITFKGEEHSVAEWSRIVNIKHSTILGRLKRGWSPEQALTISTKGQHKKIT